MKKPEEEKKEKELKELKEQVEKEIENKKMDDLQEKVIAEQAVKEKVKKIPAVPEKKPPPPPTKDVTEDNPCFEVLKSSGFYDEATDTISKSADGSTNVS